MELKNTVHPGSARGTLRNTTGHVKKPPDYTGKIYSLLISFLIISKKKVSATANMSLTS
jgi:hypothetical protein